MAALSVGSSRSVGQSRPRSYCIAISVDRQRPCPFCNLPLQIRCGSVIIFELFFQNPNSILRFIVKINHEPSTHVSQLP